MKTAFNKARIIPEPQLLCSEECKCHPNEDFEDYMEFLGVNIHVNKTFQRYKTQDCLQFNAVFDKTERTVWIPFLQYLERNYNCSGLCPNDW